MLHCEVVGAWRAGVFRGAVADSGKRRDPSLEPPDDGFAPALRAFLSLHTHHGGSFDGAMVSFTLATSALSANGLARKANCWFSGRLFSNASSA